MAGDKLGYEFRMDGNFLVRLTCLLCGDQFDAHALQNSDPMGRCPACIQVDKWSAEVPR